MINLIQNIPDIKTYPLNFVFENMKLQHKPNTLWLEFGVQTGRTINYFSNLPLIKYMVLIALKGYQKNGETVMRKEAFLCMVFYHM